MQGTQQSLRKGTILSGNSYNYKIEGILGQGSSGIAYLASIQLQGELGCLNTHTQVAIKEFFQKNFNGREGTTVTCSNEKAFKEYKTKFLREAKNLSKLKHPHIVDILEAFEANNTCYYVMEYLEGGSFDSYIKAENGLSESEALTCIRQIGEALQFMHNNRMLHLDLKPKNIMRRKDGSIVLIDFGLSKQYNSQGEPETSTAIGYGTPGYAPIEQSCYRDGEGFPITIDIYALGATLFKTLTGKTPPNASNIMNYGFPEAELQERNISNKTITAIRHAMKPEKNASPFLLLFLHKRPPRLQAFPIHSADCRLGFLRLFFLNPCFAVTQDSQHLIDNVLGARACDAVEIAEHPRGGKIGVHLAVCNFPAEVVRVTVVF